MSERLIPRRLTIGALALLGGFTPAFAVTGLLGSGPTAASMLLSAVATGGCLVAALATLARRRPRRPLTARADGAVVISSPRAAAVGLVVAWVAALGVATLLAWIAVTDYHRLEVPGAALVTIVGAVATTPDLVRLLTGRLHRWRLVLRPDSLVYRGYRTSVRVPWRDVLGVAVQRRRPPGVRVETRAGVVVLPAAAFLVPADQLVDEIRARAAAHG